MPLLESYPSNMGLPFSYRDIEQFQNLALEACIQEIDAACDQLSISADPFNWNVKDVEAWIKWTARQYGLGGISIGLFMMDGISLCNLNEVDFMMRAPLGGDVLYAQLQVWKTAANMAVPTLRPEDNSFMNQWNMITGASSQNQMMMTPFNQNMNMNMNNNNQMISCMDSMSDRKYMSEEESYPEASSPEWNQSVASPSYSSDDCSEAVSPPPPSLPTSIISMDTTSCKSFPSPSSTSSSPNSPSSSPTSAMNGGNNVGSGGNGMMVTSSVGRQGSGSHIHLWQFLKELLLQPQLYGSCIRWLDRQKGIFKIEDSLRVARLWGKRKNRPAMNYDKLSRSIRQYYKKGIMKKTERSQRLVYQFCPAYAL